MKPEKRIVMNLLLPSNVTVLIMIVAVGFSMAIGGVGNAHKEHIANTSGGPRCLLVWPCTMF